MTFGQSIKHVFSNYANFQGRASRSEFWWWYLFVLLVALIPSIIANIGVQQSLSTVSVNDATGALTGGSLNGLAIFGIVLSVLWSLAVLIPTLAVGCRRFHDTDRSGWWWLLWYLCCFVGAIIVIVFWASPGTPGPNRFGDGPARAE